MSTTILLQKAKELNTPRGNYIKTKQELEKAIKDIIVKYEEIIFGVDSPTCVTAIARTLEATSNR